MVAFVEKIRQNPILKSSIGLLLISLVIKIFGYVEKIILAYYFGTSYQVDAYTVVLTVILTVFFFFREIIEPGFLNVFLKARNKSDEKGAWDLFNQGIRFIVLLTLTITIIVILFPGNIVHLFAPGFENDKFRLSAELIQIAIPACIFLAVSTLTNITLNGLKIFALPASGEIAFKGMIIFCLVVFGRSLGIAGAAWGVLIGAMARLAVHLIILYKKINLHHIEANRLYLTSVWTLTWPLLIGVTFSQIGGIIDNIFASYLQEGAIAALSYSKKIVELPVIIFPYILSIVVFPYFSQLAIEEDCQKLTYLLSESFRWITIAFIPISIFFYVFSNSIISILLQRGAFGAHSTLLTAQPLAIYSTGLLFFAIETVLVIFYYANADTKTPVFIGIGCVIVNIMLTWLFIHIIGYIGIALAYVIQKVLKTTILIWLLKRKFQFNFKRLLPFVSKMLVSGMGFAMVILILKFHFYHNGMGLLGKVVTSVGAFVAGGIVYLAMLYFAGEMKKRSYIPIENTETR
jgi:putative peptidoglycan lipid II flippase